MVLAVRAAANVCRVECEASLPAGSLIFCTPLAAQWDIITVHLYVPVAFQTICPEKNSHITQRGGWRGAGAASVATGLKSTSPQAVWGTGH